MAGKPPRKVKVNVDVHCFEQDNMWVAYCPALDWSTYGDTLEEAQEAFPVALRILIEDLIDQGRLEKELIRLGWTLTLRTYIPPTPKARTLNSLGNHTSSKHSFYVPSVGGASQLAVA